MSESGAPTRLLLGSASPKAPPAGARPSPSPRPLACLVPVLFSCPRLAYLLVSLLSFLALALHIWFSSCVLLPSPSLCAFVFIFSCSHLAYLLMFLFSSLALALPLFLS